MKLEDFQREAERLTPEELRELIRILVQLNLRRDEQYKAEMFRRLDDKDPANWISLKEAKRQLATDGL